MGISLTARSQGVGINTTTPEATLHVKGADTMDPFMVEYGDSVKLKTFQNGGTSIGSGTIPPKDGLYVKGTLQPDSGIVAPKKLVIESEGKSITLKAGNSIIVMDENGNISITSELGGDISITTKLGGNINIASDVGGYINIATKSGGTIGIKANNGKLDLSATTLNLTGDFVNINATNALTVKGGAATNISSNSTMDISSNGTTNIKGAILKLNNGGTPVAKMGSTTKVSAVMLRPGYSEGSGTITPDNISSTILVP